MKALVTGADGLLGSRLVPELISHDFSVRAFVLPQSDSPTLDGLPIEVIRGNLLDQGSIENAIKGCEYVFHCAAITDLRAKADIVWKVNLDGTEKILKGCVKEKVKRLIYVGSASSFMFGTKEIPGDETSSFPELYKGIPYMESKKKATELVMKYINEKKVDGVIIAPTFLLGDMDFRPSSGELIRQFIKRGLRFVPPGGRNFAYAGDVAKAMVAAVKKGQSGECYITGGQNISYFDFFSKVASMTKTTKPPAMTLPFPLVLAGGALGSVADMILKKQVPFNLQLARLSVYTTYYSSKKAVEKLGMPQTEIETGIKESISSLKKYGHI